jgi:hypothetical protein
MPFISRILHKRTLPLLLSMDISYRKLRYEFLVYICSPDHALSHLVELWQTETCWALRNSDQSINCNLLQIHQCYLFEWGWWTKPVHTGLSRPRADPKGAVVTSHHKFKQYRDVLWHVSPKEVEELLPLRRTSCRLSPSASLHAQWEMQTLGHDTLAPKRLKPSVLL